MRATDRKRSPLFSGINIEARIPAKGTEAYAVSRCRRKMIEEGFGWRSASQHLAPSDGARRGFSTGAFFPGGGKAGGEAKNFNTLPIIASTNILDRRK
ncbi:hypothetical protein [Zoogloea sp.]|uniref:hypothetical protein n=1 Tax=Zoogloea sp. TaxID=49181 RepID=UPI0035B30026